MGLLAWARHFSGRQVVRGEDQLFSFKEEYLEQMVLPNIVATLFEGELTEVPAGEVWVVTNVSLVNGDGASTNAYIRVSDGVTNYTLASVGALAQTDSLDRQGWVPMTEGCYVMGTLEGAADTDDPVLGVLGFKMTLEAL